MKCIYCGNNLNIDDKFCSSCGKENTHAIQHRKDMQHYQDDYNKTKRFVIEKSDRKVSQIAKVTIIAGLVLVFILISYANNRVYQISAWFDKIEIKSDIKSHRSNLDKLEAERDFFGLAAYYNANDLYISDDLQEYRAIADASENYLSIYENTFKMLSMDEDSSQSIEKYAEFISDYIAWTYKKVVYNEYWPEQYSEIHMAAMEDLISELETFIHVYLNVPKEDIQNFSKLSAPKIQLIIERSVGYVQD